MRAIVLVAATLALACSSTRPPSEETAAGDGGSAPVGPSGERAWTSSFALEMDLEVPPRTEAFMCQFMRLPRAEDGDKELYVVGTRHEYTAGSHHYLLYRTDKASIDPGTDVPFDCGREGGTMLRGVKDFVFGGQTPRDERAMPEGIAVPLRSEEIVMMQAHYVNPQGTALRANVHLELRMVPATRVRHRAGVIRMYDPFIYVGPKERGATAQMRCRLSKEVTLISAVPHMHARGVEHATWLDGPGKLSDAPLLRATDWEHPDEWRGSMVAPKDSHLRVRCTYDNPSDEVKTQGQSAEHNEMCMTTLTYFPAPDTSDDPCVDLEGFGAGKATCPDTVGCIQQCPAGEAPRLSAESGGLEVGPCWQRCFTASCPNASDPALGMLGCAGSRCRTECAGDGAACTQCATQKCAAEVQACYGLQCADLAP